MLGCCLRLKGIIVVAHVLPNACQFNICRGSCSVAVSRWLFLQSLLLLLLHEGVAPGHIPAQTHCQSKQAQRQGWQQACSPPAAAVVLHGDVIPQKDDVGAQECRYPHLHRRGHTVDAVRHQNSVSRCHTCALLNIDGGQVEQSQDSITSGSYPLLVSQSAV